MKNLFLLMGLHTFFLYMKNSNCAQLLGKIPPSSTIIIDPLKISRGCDLKSFKSFINAKDDNKINEEEINQYLNENPLLNDKKLISISPGGLKGFYQLGVCDFIKKNYNLDNYLFSGASAGSWNSLYLAYKGDPQDFISYLFNLDFKNCNTILDMQYKFKFSLLEKYNSNDFDLEKIFIGITNINNFQLETNIYGNFEDLEDVIEGCIASSNIPFLTGDLFSKYHNNYGYDGGFSKNPYINLSDPVLHISPSMWNGKKKNLKKGIISDFLRFKSINLYYLFEKGKYDTRFHREYLDSIFLENISISEEEINETDNISSKHNVTVIDYRPKKNKDKTKNKEMGADL